MALHYVNLGRSRDPAIRERFSTYRFAYYKERVADLLARVVRVSVGTMGIVDEIRAARRASSGG